MVVGLILAGLIPQVAHAQQAASAPAAQSSLALEPGAEENTFSIQARNATLGAILDELREVAGLDIAMPEILRQQKVNLERKDVSMETLLQALGGSHALVYERDEAGNYRLVSARLTSREQLEQKELSRRDRRELQRGQRDVQKTVGRIKGIYGYAGVLDYDQAKSLVQEREKQLQALIDELAAMGAGGARAMYEAFPTLTGTRERQAMIKALALIDDPEASSVLGAWYEDTSVPFSLKRDILGALGRRGDEAAYEALSSIVMEESDVHLLGATMQALSSQGEAASLLSGVAQSDSQDLDVRREAVHSLGLVNSEEGLNALQAVATSEEDLRLRESAIQEMARSYGNAALPSLESLLSDPSEAIRANSVRAIGRVKTEEGTALLTRTAENHPDEGVRTRAQALLKPAATEEPAVTTASP